MGLWHPSRHEEPAFSKDCNINVAEKTHRLILGRNVVANKCGFPNLRRLFIFDIFGQKLAVAK